MADDQNEFYREYRDRATYQTFVKHFYKNIQQCSTYEKAYELTEQQHREVYHQNCYASYHSFRGVKRRKLKRKET